MKLSAPILALLLSTFWSNLATAADYLVDIRDCGAVGDGATLCTAAIQKAVDQCAAHKGGTVRIPAGTWLTGTVYLESNLTLILEKNATLLGSRNHEDYAQPRAATTANPTPSSFRHASILAGSELENVTIRGEGTIDGQGDAFRDKSKRRPHNLYFKQCRNVTVEGIRLRNAGSWMQHYRHCDGLTIRNIDVFNHASFNNDGLDVDSCRNVLIEHCRIDSDDDAIVIKSLSRDPCQNLIIRHCTAASHCNAIKLGTESEGGFQNVEISHCTVHSPRMSQEIYGVQRGLGGVALEMVDGGTLENVTVSNVDIDGVTVPIFLRLGNRARTYGTKTPKPGVGTFQKVVLRDITARNVSKIGCSITGLPGHAIKDVVLENIQLQFDGGGTKDHAARSIAERPESYPESTMFGVLPAYGFYCRHAEGLVFRNVTLHHQQPDLRPAMVFDDVKQLTIDGLTATATKDAQAVLRLTQVEEATIRHCKAPAAANPFLLVEGDRTRKIVLKQNDMSQAARALTLSPNVSAEAVSSD